MSGLGVSQPLTTRCLASCHSLSKLLALSLGCCTLARLNLSGSTNQLSVPNLGSASVDLLVFGSYQGFSSCKFVSSTYRAFFSSFQGLISKLQFKFSTHRVSHHFRDCQSCRRGGCIPKGLVNTILIAHIANKFWIQGVVAVWHCSAVLHSVRYLAVTCTPQPTTKLILTHTGSR